MSSGKSLTKNNLKAIIESRGYGVSDVQKLFGVTQQQVYKYINGQNELSITNLAKLAKFLNCDIKELYPDLDLEGKTEFLGFKGENRKLLTQNTFNKYKEEVPEENIKNTDKDSNTILVKHYGLFYFINEAFNAITVSNFLTLNPKLIKLFLSIIAVITFINYYMYNNTIFNPDLDSNVKLKALVDFLDLHIVSLGLVMGLCLPLLIQWWLAYIPLFLGLNTLSFMIAKSITGKVLIGTHFANILVHVVSLIFVLIYALIIRKLKNKNINN